MQYSVKTPLNSAINFYYHSAFWTGRVCGESCARQMWGHFSFPCNFLKLISFHFLALLHLNELKCTQLRFCATNSYDLVPLFYLLHRLLCIFNERIHYEQFIFICVASRSGARTERDEEVEIAVEGFSVKHLRPCNINRFRSDQLLRFKIKHCSAIRAGQSLNCVFTIFFNRFTESISHKV